MQPAHSQIRVFRFGVFEIDLEASELRKSGVRLKLAGQPFQVLVLLLSRAGEVVSREELRRHLWPENTFVDHDLALKKAINRLREVLGDSAESPRFIETVPRRGYRFVGGLVASANAEPGSARVLEFQPLPVVIQKADRRLPRRRWLVGMAVAACLVLLVLFVPLQVFWQQRAPAASLVERRLTSNPEDAPVLAAAISPDGKYLAYANRASIYIKETSSGETHPLQLPQALHAIPNSWFPDSSNLVLSSAPRMGEPSSLWTISILGGDPKKLMDDAFGAAVSPDGQRIVFLRGGPDYDRFGHEIWVMDANGENTRPIAQQSKNDQSVTEHDKTATGWGSWFTSVVWSSTGEQIAYSHAIPGPETATLSLETRSIANPDSKHTLASNLNLQPAICWISDGRVLYSQRGEPLQEPAVWSMRVDPNTGVETHEPKRLPLAGNLWAMAATSDARKLMLLRVDSAFQIFISERLHASEWGPLRRLSLDQHNSWPWAWTPDSKAVLFTSDIKGKSEVFKQEVGQPTAKLLATSTGHIRMVRLMPDGNHVLYSEMQSWFPSGPIKLLKYPLAGGPPEVLLKEVGINNFQCARLPSTICVFDQPVGKTLTLFAYDTVTGVRRELGKLTDDLYGSDWDLSPDGRRIVALLPNGLYHVYELAAGKSFEFSVKGWKGLHTVMWSPDSKTILSAVSTPDGGTALIEVDLHGNARPVLVSANNIPLVWSIPSPDGRSLAIMAPIGENNVFLIENF